VVPVAVVATVAKDHHFAHNPCHILSKMKVFIVNTQTITVNLVVSASKHYHPDRWLFGLKWQELC
jgi:hypothetical protein